jgi:hypothetical protein
MRAALLALTLLILGFCVGYGFHTVQSAPVPDADSPLPGKTSGTDRPVPVVKGLRASPDDRLLAFTAVYDRSRQASRFLLDWKSARFSAVDTPSGWQDFIVQWSPDGRKILFDREKIPRPVADASPGLYQEEVRLPTSAKGNEQFHRSQPELMTPKGVLPPNEKSVAGFWTPHGILAVKTRREPKALYLLRNGRLQLVDQTSVTYYQNRAVLEGGATVLYVVRDIPGQPGKSALFRVQGQQSRRLSGPLQDIVWAYVSENAGWMIVCRDDKNGEDWQWTLYRITPRNATVVRAAQRVPGDVIAVFWSPDFKRILGTGGKSLWTIDIPTLQVRQLGARSDWNADDATWLARESAVIVAAAGKFWKVAVPSGAGRQIWQLPPQYWR